MLPVAELPLQIDSLALGTFCQRRGIRRMRIYGSVLRGDFDPVRSDVDVLVEFEDGVRVGLDFFGYQDELSELFGRRVDLKTPDCLSRYYRAEVLREALTIYEQA